MEVNNISTKAEDFIYASYSAPFGNELYGHMSRKEIEKIIVKEYECPVCMNYASPPILMCSSSHLICYSCWKKCPTCPTCRIPKTPCRSFVLEDIYPLLTFPCKYSNCTFEAKNGLTIQHERNCEYVPIKCPFDENFQCHWHGSYKDAEAHFTQNHPHNVYFDNSVVLVHHRFKESMENRFVMVFCAFGNIFQLKWEYNLQSPVVKFNIKNFGYRQDDPNKYTYRIEFNNEKKRGLKGFTMIGDIPSMFEQATGDFNALLSELLHAYSKKRRTLTYSVSIVRHPPGVRQIIKV